jgi:non-heme Fe2+,alpha-ketoglutarate-dependent halogenase
VLNLLRLYFLIFFWNRPSTSPPELKDSFQVAQGIKRSSSNGFYLSNEEISEFEKNGFLGPIKILERNEALKLGEIIHSKVMEGDDIVFGYFPSLKGTQRVEALKEIGIETEGATERGWYRHLNVPEILELLTKDEVSHRLASLLGNNVILWRSQIFERKPGGPATTLHQATDFALEGNQRVLAPTTDRESGLIQLSFWIALTDTDEKSANLIFLPGSHRTDWIAKRQYPQVIRYDLATASLKRQWKFASTYIMSKGPVSHFTRGEVLIDIYKEKFPEIFASGIRDMRLKAGEAVIFTSKCLHGSRANTTSDSSRLAVGGRFTTTDVIVYPDGDIFQDILHFKPLSPSFKRQELKCVLVHGKDEFQHNIYL